MIQTDVLILGGGPSGLSAALALLQDRQLKVVMIDKGKGRAIPVGEHLQPPARSYLKKLDALACFEQQAHSASHSVASAWGSDLLYYKDYFTTFSGTGWHLDRAVFEEGLTALAIERGMQHLSGLRFSHAEEVDYGWLVSLSAPTSKLQIKSRIVIDASGRNAIFAKKQGAEKIAVDRLNAVTCLFSGDSNQRASQYDSMVESVAQGWWYSASLKDSRLMVSFMTDKPLIQELRLHKEENFLSLLDQSQHTQQRTKDRLLQVSPKIQDASSYLLHPCYGDNWLAVGDAACGYDPLSAMGLCKALQSGIQAAEAIMQQDSNQPAAFAEYAVQVKTAFHEFCTGKMTMYSNEQRWTNSPFWQNRLPGIWLDPTRSVIVNSDFNSAKHKVGDFWLSEDLQHIWEVCRHPIRAVDLLQKIRSNNSDAYQDSWLIQGVQNLLSEGLLITVDGI